MVTPDQARDEEQVDVETEQGLVWVIMTAEMFCCETVMEVFSCS